MVQSKLPVKDKEKPSWSRKKDLPDVTPSFHNYMIKRVAQDFQHSVLHVSDLPFEEKEFSSFPTCHYEFPNGYNQVSNVHGICVTLIFIFFPLNSGINFNVEYFGFY